MPEASRFDTCHDAIMHRIRHEHFPAFFVVSLEQILFICRSSREMRIFPGPNPLLCRSARVMIGMAPLANPTLDRTTP